MRVFFVVVVKPHKDFREAETVHAAFFPESPDQTALRSVQHRKHTLNGYSWGKKASLVKM